MHDWLIATWYGAGDRGRWLRPAAWIFSVLARMRRALYARGWRVAYRSARPVVIVGNLTVGGTGKTPIVVWLARALLERGLRVGVASRGYRADTRRARIVTDADTARTAGDEAVLLKRRLAVPVAIGARRAEAVRLLEPECEIVLCDDGLQHYALARDFEIAVVDGTRGLGNGRLLPAGPLREPAPRLASVDAVVVNGPGFAWPGAIRMRLEPAGAVSLRDGSRVPLARFAGRQAIAAAAIGNPGRFFALLRAHGIEIEAQAWPDHGKLVAAALPPREGRPVLMTEKDAVKCAGSDWDDAWYVEVEAVVDADAAGRLLDRIQLAVAGRRNHGS